jgi:hypothetical protein
MHCLRKSASFLAALLMAPCASVDAGSIHLHQSKAELAAADLRFYERVVAMRDLAPEKFDHVHPLAGRMLSDDRVYERLLDQWLAHPRRFELAHPCLWHVLDGYSIYRREHPFISAIDTPSGLPIRPLLDPPSVDPPPLDPPIPPGGVPEPSSVCLSLTAFILVAAASAVRRGWRRSRRCA